MKKISVKKLLNILLVGAILLFAFIRIVEPTIVYIEQRHQTERHFYVHDNPIQLEEATRMVLEGKNPYIENYFGTPLENWRYIGEPNPALYHFVTLPFHFLFSAPFFLASEAFLGWFDQRFIYIFSFLLTIFLILKWPKKSIYAKLALLIILVANPWFRPFFIEGRNDIFVFGWIVLVVYLLERQKIKYSLVVLALATVSKQSAWFILPFYFAYLYFANNIPSFLMKIKVVVKQAIPFLVVVAIVVIPFLVWGFGSFIDDTLHYPAGTSEIGNYPIKGIGIQRNVLQLRLVDSPTDYWPFWVPELIVSLPLLLILLWLQKKNNTLGQMVFNFSMLLLAFWFFSRFFNTNYFGFIIMLFAFAIFLYRRSPISSSLAEEQSKK